MKLKTVAILILLSIAAAALACFAVGCSSTEDAYNPDTWEGAIVTFALEGGEYKNSKNAVEYYYQLGEDEEVRIGTPTDYSDKAVTRPDYSLEGWCKTRTETGEEGVYEYSDPWDFQTEVVKHGDRITLYANWTRLIKYSYNVCYKDADGETVIIGTYEVDEGARFNDYSKYANKIPNVTPMPGAHGTAFYDENDQPWDANFRHPGGEEDTAINVYIHYIIGVYKLIYTPDDLNRVTANDNAYLMNDIDFEGETLRSLKDYRGIFLGNGHTVKNFNINRGTARGGGYGKDDIERDGTIDDGGLICISIFGNAVGARISDVHFVNVSIDVNASYGDIDKVYIAPLFVKMTEFAGNVINPRRATTATGVTFEGTVTISALHDGLTREEDIIIVTDRAYYMKDEASSVSDDCTVSLVEAPQAQQTASVELYNDVFTRKKEY